VLKEKGLHAIRVSSEERDSEEMNFFGGRLNDRLGFEVTSPESLGKACVRNALDRFTVFGMSVDEGHCVSECKLTYFFVLVTSDFFLNLMIYTNFQRKDLTNRLRYDMRH